MGLFDRLFGRKKEKQAEVEETQASSEVVEQEEFQASQAPHKESKWSSEATSETSEAVSLSESIDALASETKAPSWVKDVLDSENFMADYNALKSSLAEDNDILSESVADAQESSLSEDDYSEGFDSPKESEIKGESASFDEPEAQHNQTKTQPKADAQSNQESATADTQSNSEAVNHQAVQSPDPTKTNSTEDSEEEPFSESSLEEGQTSLEPTSAPVSEQEEDSQANPELDSQADGQVKQPVPEPAEASITQETEQDKYNRSLKKTRTGFGARLNAFFANFRRVDEEFFEDLEEMLILSDVGVQVATNLTEELRYEVKLENAKKTEDVRRVVIEKLVDIYEKDGQFKETINFQDGLTVMLFVGVNGVGKTTSIGKLAYKYKNQGKKVMLVAADTFRAGAVAQLQEWGNRVGVPVITGPEKADPASVVFDGMEKAVAQGVDILMIDTAGRLQNKENLMAELEKIGRIVKRVLPDAPHETLLTLDASTGQNALSQAKEFSKITPLTGLVLTKIDGTAKGGIVLAIRQELDIPVKFIGFGEKIDDIGEFHSEEFMQGLLEGLI